MQNHLCEISWGFLAQERASSYSRCSVEFTNFGTCDVPKDLDIEVMIESRASAHRRRLRNLDVVLPARDQFFEDAIRSNTKFLAPHGELLQVNSSR